MSVRSRLSDASTLRLIVSGRLSMPPASAVLEVEAELRRDHDLVADGLERLADELLVRERPVHLRGVEEGDPAFDRGADQADHLVPVGERRVALAHPHAAEPDRRDLQALSPSVRFCIVPPAFVGCDTEAALARG